MNNELATIYTAANTVQAHLLRNALANVGIAAQVTNDALQVAGGDLPLGWTIAPRVVVPREQEAEARRLAEQYDASLIENRKPSAVETAAPAAPVAPPSCPSCGRFRIATCPYCHTCGDQFPAADAIGEADGPTAPALLICPSCDEPFPAVYLRQCQWCGHEFADGVESPPVLATLRFEPVNWRVMAVGIACLAMIAGVLIYFASLL